jgi:photosystem II stability/assembly factor-like uncharacterized protein
MRQPRILNRSTLCALTCAAMIAAPATGVAQTPAPWVSRGPFCARPFGIAAAQGLASRAYLAVGGSLFRSVDRWASWSRVEAQLPASYLSSVAVAPQNANLVYFSIWDHGGVFRSSDGGQTWTQVFRGLPDDLVGDLVVPASPSGTVFVMAPYRGFFRSRDQGETWTDVTPPEPLLNFYRLLAHPRRSERLVAHSYGGLWRSDNGGDTWRQWNAGLPLAYDGAVVGPLYVTVVPTDQDVAFAVSAGTLYRSVGGTFWTRIGRIATNSSGSVHALAAAPGGKPVLFAGQNGERSTIAGILRSRDGGVTWQPAGLAGEAVYNIAYLPAIGRIVAMTARGAFYSTDLGKSWKRTGAGVVAARVRSIAAAASGSTLVAGLEQCPGGIARSADGGVTWQIQEMRDPTHYYGGQLTDVEAVAFAPSRPKRVYAGAMDEVLRSDDGGVTWAHFPFNDGLTGGRTVAIAVHPTDPNMVFAAGSHGVTRSRDGGRTWTHAVGDATAIAIDPARPQRVLAASWSGGVWRSLDGGGTWALIPATDFLRVAAFAIDPKNPELVLASSLFEDSLYRSDDFGTNWAPSDVGIDGVMRGLSFNDNGSEVVAVGDTGVFRSTDRGRTWVRVPGAPAVGRTVARQGPQLHVATDVGVVSGRASSSP